MSVQQPGFIRESTLQSQPGTAPWWVGRRHPVWLAVGLAAVTMLLTAAIGVGGRVFAPTADPISVRLAAVLFLAVGACVVVGGAGAWRRVGAGGPAGWRQPGLLIVPGIIALAPIVTGIELPGGSLLIVLVVGYVATGVFEELWHRGLILDVLRGLGVRRSAILGGALFAGTHLANVVFGQPIAVTLAQAVGAFCFGVGFSLMRWRTNAIWLLIAIHATGDLLLHITGLHGGLLWVFLVGHDIAMGLWGLWCLRGLRDEARVLA
ncbi:CPBP family intramembrane metalloprotease [Pseudactinotalea sp. HY160]|uniref:CPBP family intramembrane glutamic endopeptidase n=1 Tax=Pseudactinotalea sp. HY160 TaxID=2654490 RepID=UPI0013124715|nr:CPBP family intramembrane glutamic endopeptidase [Pseudactinotalea sp. HY160]MPV49200.1 CPBP family intramembrane metalloprotease [Pseudactinotalea sp. HY160]